MKRLSVSFALAATVLGSGLAGCDKPKVDPNAQLVPMFNGNLSSFACSKTPGTGTYETHLARGSITIGGNGRVIFTEATTGEEQMLDGLNAAGGMRCDFTALDRPDMPSKTSKFTCLDLKPAADKKFSAKGRTLFQGEARQYLAFDWRETKEITHPHLTQSTTVKIPVQLKPDVVMKCSLAPGGKS